jgi:hypothetical protein
LLLQLLKDQPAAEIKALTRDPGDRQGPGGQLCSGIVNGERSARLVRSRVKWNDPNKQPYALTYDDNYSELFPGERKRVHVDFGLPGTFTGTITGTVIVEGTNVPQVRVPIRFTGYR